ncbi:MAG: hypothetical protein HFJ51_03350 [Clostridia bacterium]|nr:hypothetical protein [Clostridia bacterium]
MKFMLLDILENVEKFRKRPLQMTSVAIFIRQNEEIFNGQIIELARKIKSLKIVTEDVKKFWNLEENLYIEYGIAIQITNNKSKALTNVDIVVNYDFEEEEINKYLGFKTCDVINIKNKVKITDKSFEGCTFSDYTLEYNQELLNGFNDSEGFNSTVLYEGLIYRRDTYQNIRRQIDKDCVKLRLNT